MVKNVKITLLLPTTSREMAFAHLDPIDAFDQMLRN
jgi:hypothetical protein